MLWGIQTQYAKFQEISERPVGDRPEKSLKNPGDIFRLTEESSETTRCLPGALRSTEERPETFPKSSETSKRLYGDLNKDLMFFWQKKISLIV